MMNRQSLLKELEKQKGKINIAEEKKENETNKSLTCAGVSKVTSSPVKRKKKYHKTSSKQWVETFRDKLDDAEKNKIKIYSKKRMKEMRDNLDDNEKSKIKSDSKKRMKETRDNLDDNEKSKIKSENKMK